MSSPPNSPFAVFGALLRGYGSLWIVGLACLFVCSATQMAIMAVWWGLGWLLAGTAVPSGPIYALLALVAVLWAIWMLIAFIGPVMHEAGEFMMTPANLTKLTPSLAVAIIKRHLQALLPSMTAIRALQDEIRRDVRD